jgi:NTP pyrophosphatase (non-canonical NTP hydrolase)
MVVFDLQLSLTRAISDARSLSEIVQTSLSTVSAYIVSRVVLAINPKVPPRAEDLEPRIAVEVADLFHLGYTDAQLISKLCDLATEWVAKVSVECTVAAVPVPVIYATPVDAEHAELQAQTCKPGEAIKLTALSAHLVHMALGVAGEAGELVDAIKKQAIYCKQVDLENIIEELGDLEWYMQGIRAALCITREQVLTANITKLRKRYSSGSYSNQQAVERKDKEPSTDAPTTPFESNDE